MRENNTNVLIDNLEHLQKYKVEESNTNNLRLSMILYYILL